MIMAGQIQDGRVGMVVNTHRHQQIVAVVFLDTSIHALEVAGEDTSRNSGWGTNGETGGSQAKQKSNFFKIYGLSVN
jgi:hypothetical protein